MDNISIKLSPSSLDLFLECPLCFWLEKRMKIRRPPPFPYALNTAVDQLLKAEFDNYRKKGELHPILAENNVPAKLFADQQLLDKWRNNFQGIRYYDPQLKATLFGAVDDILEFEGKKLSPLDFKATGSREAKVYDRFQLQMDVYTYLLKKNSFDTYPKGYLAFYVVEREDGFDGRLPFKEVLREVQTDISKVPELFQRAVSLLRGNKPSAHSPDCKFGHWYKRVSEI